MLITFLLLFFLRPFICSAVFTFPNHLYSWALLVFLVYWLIKRQRIPRPGKGATAGFISLVTVIVLSIILNHNKSAAFGNASQYITGILLFLACSTFSPEEKNRLIKNIILAGFTISLLAFYDYFVVFPALIREAPPHVTSPFFLEYLRQRRVFFPMISPNALGGYLAMLIPVALGLRHGAGLAFVFLLALFLTKSIGAACSLFISLIVYFYLQGKTRTRHLLFLSGSLAAAALVYFVRTQTGTANHLPVFSLTMRWHYWKETAAIIQAHPWKGVGPGNFNLPDARDSHNVYLQLWATLGIAGLGSFLAIVGSVFGTGINALKNTNTRAATIGLLSASSGFLVHNLMDYTFFLPEVCLIWCALMGLLSSTAAGTGTLHQEPSFQRLPDTGPVCRE